jgi:hypothetical protein
VRGAGIQDLPGMDRFNGGYRYFLPVLMSLPRAGWNLKYPVLEPNRAAVLDARATPGKAAVTTATRAGIRLE